MCQSMRHWVHTRAPESDGMWGYQAQKLQTACGEGYCSVLSRAEATLRRFAQTEVLYPHLDCARCRLRVHQGARCHPRGAGREGVWRGEEGLLQAAHDTGGRLRGSGGAWCGLAFWRSWLPIRTRGLSSSRLVAPWRAPWRGNALPLPLLLPSLLGSASLHAACTGAAAHAQTCLLLQGGPLSRPNSCAREGRGGGWCMCLRGVLPIRGPELSG